MDYTFTAKLWQWDAQSKGSWYFVTVPSKYFDEIRQITDTGHARGFGSVRVEVTIGSSVWKTSIFPSVQEKSYVLPIKKSVRVAEKINPGDMVEMKVKLVGIA